jgi:hypothetical protein
VRIAAPLATLDRAALIADLVALRGDWPTSMMLEIDHDCGSRQLADYARFLVALRRALAARPAPVAHRAARLAGRAQICDGLLATVDEAVLQLHSLDKPARRLFDAAGARAWTASLARRTDKPFRVALPNYGSRVVLDGQGRIAAVESEVPFATGRVGEVPGEGRELFVGANHRLGLPALARERHRRGISPASSGSACRLPATNARGRRPPGAPSSPTAKQRCA